MVALAGSSIAVARYRMSAVSAFDIGLEGYGSVAVEADSCDAEK